MASPASAPWAAIAFSCSASCSGTPIQPRRNGMRISRQTPFGQWLIASRARSRQRSVVRRPILKLVAAKMSDTIYLEQLLRRLEPRVGEVSPADFGYWVGDGNEAARQQRYDSGW